MIFVFCGIAIAMAVWKPNRPVLKGVLLALVLTACNLFPAPTDQYLRLRDQNRKLMQQAVHALNSLPSGSIIFTDDQGGLLLSYYLCGNKTVQIEPPFRQFFIAPCRSHEVLSIDPRQWIFKSETLPDTLLDVQRTYDIARGARVWFFQSGWFIDKEQALRIELAQYGCSAAQEFGRNMFLCPITLGGRGNGDSGAL
jgi:hypothetical protein